MKKFLTTCFVINITTLLLAVGLAWDPSPDVSVTGYAIYYGYSSGNYVVRTDVGNVTNTSIVLPTNGVTYYFVATAYDANGIESLPSNEVNYNPPVVPPTNSLPSKVEEFRIMTIN